MGHNLGMLHDFDKEHGGDNGPCNGKGIMSYGSAPNVWSTCSKNDFQALYNIASSWCLDGMQMYLELGFPNKDCLFMKENTDAMLHKCNKSRGTLRVRI